MVYGGTDEVRDDFNKELIAKVRNHSIKKSRTTEHYWIRKQAHSDWVNSEADKLIRKTFKVTYIQM